MELVRTLENKLADLYKGAPALSKNTKETLANIWPYLTAVVAVLQLWAAWALWDLINKYNQVEDVVTGFLGNYLSDQYTLSSGEKMVIYVGVALLAVQAVILLLAFSPLKNRQRKGWDLVFLVSLLQIVYAVVSLFVFNHGLGDFIFNLLGAAIGFYFLFQIRDQYKGASSAKKA